MSFWGDLWGAVSGAGETVWNAISGNINFTPKEYNVKKDAFKYPEYAARQKQLTADYTKAQKPISTGITKTIIGGGTPPVVPIGPRDLTKTVTKDQGGVTVTKDQGGVTVPPLAPPKAPIAPRQTQLGLAGQMAGRLSGQTQGASGLQARLESDKVLSQSSGATGTGPQAIRRAALVQSQVGGQAAQMAGQGTAQEQARMGQTYGQTLTAAKATDMAKAAFDAMQSQQSTISKIGINNSNAIKQAYMNGEVDTFNLQNKLKAQGMSDQQATFYLSQMLGVDLKQLEMDLAYDRAKYNAYIAPLNIKAGIALANMENQGRVIGGALSGVGTAIASWSTPKPGQTAPQESHATNPDGSNPWTSDIRAKENINSSAKEVDELLKKLKPYEWKYKNPKLHGVGKHAGVMAQDLEKSKLGKTMVSSDVDGTKVLDMKKGFGLIMASIARLDQKFNELRDIKKGKK